MAPGAPGVAVAMPGAVVVLLGGIAVAAVPGTTGCGEASGVIVGVAGINVANGVGEITTGVALGDDNVQQFDNVMKFQKAMTNYRRKLPDGGEARFMDGFINNVEFENIMAVHYHSVPANLFTFKLTTRAWGTEENPAKPGQKNLKGKSDRQVASAE